jgi:hypothetical protein
MAHKSLLGSFLLRKLAQINVSVKPVVPARISKNRARTAARSAIVFIRESQILFELDAFSAIPGNPFRGTKVVFPDDMG